LVRRVSTPADHIAVIGAGTSVLVAELLQAGYTDIEAIDLSQVALDRLVDSCEAMVCGTTPDGAHSQIEPEHMAENSLVGAAPTRGLRVRCVDVRAVCFEEPVTVWHDRAVLHFLTDPADQAAYVARARDAVVVGGHVVLAESALTGPAQCSGLPVARHETRSLAALFAPHFSLVESSERTHVTPAGVEQQFVHALLRRTADSR
jgi:hypothetical protein